MPQSAAPNPQGDADRLEVATEQAIAACGGNVRDALKAMILANEFLESEVCELMQAVSHAYARGRFKPIQAEAMDSEKNPDGSNVHYIKRAKNPLAPTNKIKDIPYLGSVRFFFRETVVSPPVIGVKPPMSFGRRKSRQRRPTT
jgi:hypothetical protein